MFIYARSEQYDLGPIYTITNTQRIRIYPSKLKFILVKISPDPGRLHGKHAKENQTLFTFLTTENLSGVPCEVQIGSALRFIQLCWRIKKRAAHSENFLGGLVRTGNLAFRLQ